MQKLRQLARYHAAFIFLSLLAFCIGMTAALSWYHYLINPDATAYFSIAHQYANFDLKSALNGYWGPLLSWFLAVAVWLHLDLVYVSRFLFIVASLSAAAVTYGFLIGRGASRWLASLVGLTTLVTLESAAVGGPVTPDLFLAFFVILFGCVLSKFVSRPSRLNALGLGLVGALMYFSKGFGLFLFVGVVGAVALIQWFRERRPVAIYVKRYAPVVLVFMILVVPFIAAISVKYHHFTISNAGSFDLAEYGPVTQGGNFPFLTSGPLSLRYPSSLSAWDDPTYLTNLIPGYGWNPLQSKFYMTYFLVSMFGTNLLAALSGWLGFGPLVAFGVLAMVAGFFSRSNNRHIYLIFGLISGLTILGYSLVYVEQRYFQAIAVLAMAAGGLWLVELIKTKSVSSKQANAIGLVALALACVILIKPVVLGRNTGLDAHENAVALKEWLPEHERLLSDDPSTALVYCYHLHLQCVGTLAPIDKTPASYAELLRQENARYYLELNRTSDSVATRELVATDFEHVKTVKFKNQTASLYKLR
jgi:hypothetical protein